MLASYAQDSGVYREYIRVVDFDPKRGEEFRNADELVVVAMFEFVVHFDELFRFRVFDVFRTNVVEYPFGDLFAKRSAQGVEVDCLHG